MTKIFVYYLKNNFFCQKFYNNMNINFLAVLVAALVSFPIGFTWYHPKVFGTAWIKELGVSFEDMGKGFSMPKAIIISFICAFLIAFSLNFNVIHQYGFYSLFQGIPEAEAEGAKFSILLNGNEIDVLSRFRTFKHGVLHGFITSLFFITPIIVQNSIYERRSFKYIAIHAGYWVVTAMLMGGIICAWE